MLYYLSLLIRREVFGAEGADIIPGEWNGVNRRLFKRNEKLLL